MIAKKVFDRNNQYPILIIVLVSFTLLILAGSGNRVTSVKAAAQSEVKQGRPAVNAAISELEPALAIRASGCLTCHTKVYSKYITDFGYGDNYFFGNPGGGGALGPFNGHVYGDFYGVEPNKTGWLTAEISEKIIVPQAGFNFDLGATVKNGPAGVPAYREALLATSLAKYLQAVENQKATPSAVIEKKKVFIGAPNVATLETRFNITPGSDVKFKFIKNDAKASPDIDGIALSADKNNYTNTKEIVCDGDLFVRGTLLLNQPTISTINGCRIYATGTIVLQKAATYKSLSGAADNANLQLVSAEAIFLGVGDKVCGAKASSDPLSSRLLRSPALASFVTRDAASKSLSPQTVDQNIYDEVRRIASLEDASCHDDALSFSRLLLNAPQVHSRYKGKFKGLVIAEFALFWQGKASFEFDPVFKKVPVLPRLKNSDYLVVE